MSLGDALEEVRNYIGGEFQRADAGDFIESFEPATGVAYAAIPNSGESDVARAVDAARGAFRGWANLHHWERATWLTKLAGAIADDAVHFAEAESRDTGKPLSVASSVDIPRAQKNLLFFAHASTQFASESHSDSGTVHYTLRQPLGPVACISPWNLPLYLLTWKIAPALAAGNTVVAKPSEVTPMTAYLLGQKAHAIGFPPGVLNIVHGAGNVSGAQLVAHPQIRAVSFTGSTRTGEIIATKCAQSFRKVSLEMGGKNATLVFADSDYDVMLDTVVRSAFSNQGQICLCGSRILVEHSILDRFVTDFVGRVGQLQVGDPRHEDTDLGAVVSEEHCSKILDHIEIAKSEGGRVLCGGKRATVQGRCAEGWFIEPTVITGLPNDCRTNQEEIFGPVVTIQSFGSDEMAVTLANDSPYGLSASVWTSNLQRAHSIAGQLDVGMVWINTWMERDLRTPFGGMKMSGVGREGGFEAMRFFTETKNVTITTGST